MDAQLRALERTFTAEKTSEALFHLLSAYPRSTSIPEIDLKILELLHEGQTFKSRGPKDHYQGIGHIDPTQLKALYGMGYQAGIYFVTKNPSGDARLVVDTLLAMLKEANRRTVNYIENLDSIDDIDVGPGNSYARARLPDGSVRYLVNALQMIKTLSISETEWLAISNTLSAYYSQITRGKKKETYGRFFIPAWVLECCYALHVNQYVQGMSRSTRRSRSNTVIDWQRSPSKVADFRRRLYDDVMGEESLGELPKDFGLNYFLAIDTTGVRPTPRNHQEQRNPIEKAQKISYRRNMEERDPDLINPDYPDWWNTVRPASWKYPEDWGSPAWKRRMAEVYQRASKLLEQYGFEVCPKCGTEHTGLTMCCRNCNHCDRP